MSNGIYQRFLATACATALAVTGLCPPASLAQGGSTTGAPQVTVVQASPRAFQALESWTTRNARPELIALEGFPHAIADYVRQVEALYGQPLTDYFATTYPDLALEVLDESGAWPLADGIELFEFLAGALPKAYATWQSESTLAAARLQFSSFVVGNHRDLQDAIDRANITPADRGETLIEHTANNYSTGDPVIGEIGELLDQLNVQAPTDTDCQCWIVYAFDFSSSDWNQPIYEKDFYQWKGITVTDIDHLYLGSGVTSDIEMEHRTKFHKHGHLVTSDHQYSTMQMRLHCTQGGIPGGSQCTLGSCGGELTTAVKYSNKTWANLNAAGTGGGISHASDVAKLTYNPGQPSEQNLLELHSGAHVEKKVVSDPKSFISSTVTLIADLVSGIYSGNPQQLLDDLGDELLDEWIDGLFKIAKTEGSEGDQLMFQSKRRDASGQMFPNVTYTLKLESQSVVRGRSWGPHTTNEARIDTSHSMTGVARNFTCTPGVTPPQPSAWWHYGAAPDAISSANNLRSGISSFVAVELGAPLPANSFNGDADTHATGSFVP